MLDNVPLEYQKEAYLLDATGMAELFQITLLNSVGVLHFTPYLDVTWQGNDWTSFPCKITGTGTQASGENVRPRMTIANPDGLLSGYVHSGVLNNALIERYRVSPDDLDLNINQFIKNTWRVSKIVTLNKNMVVLELRSALDGHNFKIPGNSFFPPDYPHVSLS